VTCCRQSEKAQCIVSIENGVANGGFGSAIGETLSNTDFKGALLRFGWPNKFVPHGAFEKLAERCGLTDEGIATAVMKVLHS